MLPSGAELAELSVQCLRDVVNSSSKTETIAGFAGTAEAWAKYQGACGRILQDGKISDEEASELRQMVEPICDRLIDEIKKYL